MSDAMVTGRLSSEKKAAGVSVLERAGLNVSQAVNLMFDRLIQEQNADFLHVQRPEPSSGQWAAAAAFVDTLHQAYSSNLDSMSKKDIKAARLKSRGLM